MVGSPDSVQKNVVLENNSLSAEQITGVENRKSKAGAATDAELARRFPAVEPGEYTRVCHLIEKHIYGEILLSPYEERTLNHFLEKLMEPVPGCSWKMRLKLRYACLRRVNTKKKKRKHSAFQQK